jgi:HPt (histidine-containing phosphotransfer) domain-containing protein
MDNLIDYDNMKKAIGSDPNLIKRIVSLYLRDAPKLLADIDEAVKAEDNKKLSDSAHSLKGITGYYNTDIPQNLCLKLEQLGKENGLPEKKDDAITLLSQLQEQISILFGQLKTYIEQI